MDDRSRAASGLDGDPETWVARLRPQLDADLMAARRRGRHVEVAAIRALKSALANAEAVPVEERPFELVEGSADVPRRVLSAAQVAAVVAAEIAERERAIAEYRSNRLDTTTLELELTTLERYRAGHDVR